MCDDKAGQCTGFSLVVVGCLLLAIFSSEHMPSYFFTKDYRDVTCTVQSSYFAGNVCCDAQAVSDIAACTDVYPCYSVRVDYTDSGDAGQSGLVIEDYDTYIYQHNATCSYYKCGATYSTSSDYAAAEASAQAFVADKGVVGTSYSCSYDPDDLDVIFLSRIAMAVAVNLILWPIVLIIAGTIVTAVFCVRDSDTNCGNSDKKGRTTVEDMEALEVRDTIYQFENATLEVEEPRAQTAASQFDIKNKELLDVPGGNTLKDSSQA